MRRWFLSFFLVGYTPVAPGTVGSVAALPVGIAILYYLDVTTLLMLTVAVTVAAVSQINEEEKMQGVHDPSYIVIDEAVGVWLALAIAYHAAVTFRIPHPIAISALLALGLFRWLDIAKPSLIGRIDRQWHGGIGVMGDDLVAGFVAGVLSALVYRLYTLQ